MERKSGRRQHRVQQHPRCETEGHRQRRDDHGEQHRVDGGPPEQRVAEQPRVVVQPDEDAVAEAVGLLQADQEGATSGTKTNTPSSARLGLRNAYAARLPGPRRGQRRTLSRRAAVARHCAVAAAIPGQPLRRCRRRSGRRRTPLQLVLQHGDDLRHLRRGDLAESSGCTVAAWPTNTGDSSGRTANSMPYSTRSARVGSSEAAAQKSRIGSVVTKSRNFAASSGCGDRWRPGRCRRSRRAARTLRGEKVAPHSKSRVGRRPGSGTRRRTSSPRSGRTRCRRRGRRLHRVVRRHEVLGEEAAGELDRGAAGVGVDGRGDQVLGQETAVGLEQPAQPAGDAVALPVVGERVLAARQRSRSFSATWRTRPRSTPPPAWSAPR